VGVFSFCPMKREKRRRESSVRLFFDFLV
jgi:hypothetical protein